MGELSSRPNPPPDTLSVEQKNPNKRVEKVKKGKKVNYRTMIDSYEKVSDKVYAGT